jgi:D-glycero-D-manno-heptose 1,7-bisphosphate phosphatase
MSIKSIFLDRDGVINKDLNYLYKIEEFQFIDGIFDVCKYFQSLDFKIIIITNQSGIFRGYYSEKEYQKLTQWMLKQFKRNNVDVLDIFHCPHGPNSKCDCRKPKPGMFLNAKEKYDIDMKNSWVVGDKENDIKAANDAGIKNTILVRSGHKIDKSSSNAMYFVDSIKDINQVILKS